MPDTGQLSQVMVQATAPAFILGAVAGFISILLGRMTSVILWYTNRHPSWYTCLHGGPLTH